MKKAFSIDSQTGLLKGVEFVSSPNQDERPQQEEPSLIVVHGISLPPNQFGGQGVKELFTNSLDPEEHTYYAEIHALRVSAHLFIRRDGSLIQFVPFNKRAWHAGLSSYKGRQKCNDFSIGIELEGTDDIPYTNKQYEVLAAVSRSIRTTYSAVSKEAIVGHSDIAPGRKTDPGNAFDWDYLKSIY